MSDIQVENQGSTVKITPMTAAGLKWIATHLLSDEYRHIRASIVISSRYTDQIITDAQDEGLDCGRSI